MDFASVLGRLTEGFGKLKMMWTDGLQWAAARHAERLEWHSDLYRDPDYLVDYLRLTQIEAAIQARHTGTRSTDFGLERKAKWTSSTSH